jgi:cytochrome c
MAYRGLKDPQDRADLIAFMRTYSDRPRDIPEAEPSIITNQPQLADEPKLAPQGPSRLKVSL